MARAGGDDDLSRTLRQLRLAAGLSGAEVARRAGFSQSKVSRQERGVLVPTPEDAETLARVLGASPEVRRRVVKMATDLWHERDIAIPRRVVLGRGAAHFQRRFKDIEESSRHVGTFVPTVVGGLLQTPAYARALFVANVTGAVHDVEDAVTARLERQELLGDPEHRWTQILTEGALRWNLGGAAVMAEQMDRIIEVSRLPTVRVGVIPWGTPAQVTALHGFNIYDGRAVIVGNWHGTAILTDQRDVTLYARLLAKYEDLAVFGDEARAVLAAVGADYRRMTLPR